MWIKIQAFSCMKWCLQNGGHFMSASVCFKQSFRTLSTLAGADHVLRDDPSMRAPSLGSLIPAQRSTWYSRRTRMRNWPANHCPVGLVPLGRRVNNETQISKFYNRLEQTSHTTSTEMIRNIRNGNVCIFIPKCLSLGVSLFWSYTLGPSTSWTSRPVGELSLSGPVMI